MFLRQRSEPELSMFANKSQQAKVEKIPNFTNRMLASKLNENIETTKTLSTQENLTPLFIGSATTMAESTHLRKSSSSSQSRPQKPLTSRLEKRASDNSSETTQIRRVISLSTARSATSENFQRPVTRPSIANFLPTEDQAGPLFKRTSLVLSRDGSINPRRISSAAAAPGTTRRSLTLSQCSPRFTQMFSTRNTIGDMPDAEISNTNATESTPTLKDPWQSCKNFPSGNHAVGKMKQEIMKQEAKRNFLSLNPYSSNRNQALDADQYKPFKIQAFQPLKVVTVYKTEPQEADLARDLTSRGTRRMSGIGSSTDALDLNEIIKKKMGNVGGSEVVKPKLFSIFEGQKSEGLQKLDFLSFTSPKIMSYSRSKKIKHVHWKPEDAKKIVQKYLDY